MVHSCNDMCEKDGLIPWKKRALEANNIFRIILIYSSHHLDKKMNKHILIYYIPLEINNNVCVIKGECVCTCCVFVSQEAKKKHTRGREVELAL